MKSQVKLGYSPIMENKSSYHGVLDIDGHRLQSNLKL